MPFFIRHLLLLRRLPRLHLRVAPLEAAVADVAVVEAVVLLQLQGLPLRQLLPLPLMLLLHRLLLRRARLPAVGVVQVVVVRDAVEMALRPQRVGLLLFPEMLRPRLRQRDVAEVEDAEVVVVRPRMLRPQLQRAHSPMRCRKPIPLAFSGPQKAPGTPLNTPIGRQLPKAANVSFSQQTDASADGAISGGSRPVLQLPRIFLLRFLKFASLPREMAKAERH